MTRGSFCFIVTAISVVVIPIFSPISILIPIYYIYLNCYFYCYSHSVLDISVLVGTHCDTSRISDRIDASLTYVIWREEHSVSVLRRVQLLILVCCFIVIHHSKFCNIFITFEAHRSLLLAVLRTRLPDTYFFLLVTLLTSKIRIHTNENIWLLLYIITVCEV
jgi:hypothetical protein